LVDVENNQKNKMNEMKLIPIDEIPMTYPENRELILKIKNLPEGMAWVVKEEELVGLGLPSTTAIRVAVNRYVKRDLLPKGFRAIQRKRDGKSTIYIAKISDKKE